MFDLTIRNQVYSSWNESARTRVRAGLAFLPADFERVVVTLEYVPKENSRQWQYCCTIRAREVSGYWHTVKTTDFDAHQALEHSVHVVARSAMGNHLDKAVASQLANRRPIQIRQFSECWNEVGFS